ncbi:MAG: glucuronate isomerase [Betaproteobacteria bacterium]
MATPLTFHPDRLFSSDPVQRGIAQRLYASVKDLPIVSPHGHTDPQWYADDMPFPDPAGLFIVPDHYVFRMLYSQGVALEDLGVPREDGSANESDPRKIWRLFARHYYLFRGTPTRMWMDHAFHEVFGIRERLGPESADRIYDSIAAQLETPAFRTRALMDRFRIETIATTESPLDLLPHHQKMLKDGWSGPGGRVLTAYRPDPVVDPDFAGFRENIARFGEISGEDTSTWSGYLAAHQNRRQFFKSMGATSTDHGHPTALTCDLSEADAAALYQRALAGPLGAGEAEIFCGQVLTEMAAMSIDDGLVMQIHPGSWRSHNRQLFAKFGRDKGADIPTATEYVRALKPLLDRFGNAPDFTLILFTLDETSYSRELAPLAGHYPCLRLGPPWWFHDSPEGMIRFRKQAIETAGFYNTVGFNDDTRAFMSIPARHDVARRIDCRTLAELVAEHRLDEDEAQDVAIDLAYRLVKKAYKL